jgi:citrate lyase subunit beta/citryl-CoA lyase
MLVVPALRPELMRKSLDSEADSLWFELEDGVHHSRKTEARDNVCQFLRTPEAANSNKELTVRVNDIRTAVGQEDVIRCARAGAPSVMLAKARSAADFEIALELIVRNEHDSGRPPGEMHLWGMIETAGAVQDLERIARVPRLRGLHFGGGDLSVELGVKKIGISGPRQVWDYPMELLYAQERTILAARVAGLAVLDAAYSDFKDLDGTSRAAAMSAQLGFDGMGALSPRQLPPIHRAFGASDEDVLWASKVVRAAKEADERGETVVILDGQLIEGPFVRSAQAILHRARRGTAGGKA